MKFASSNSGLKMTRKRHVQVLGSSRPAERHTVTLITRADCHLCEDAERVLRGLAGELGFDYYELDVDADAARKAEYSDRVPVILIDGREHGYWRVETARFRTAISKPVRP
jgi:glutaredoxin